jgi:hypothetical protein
VPPDLELALHEEPEVDVATVDDVDVQLDSATTDVEAEDDSAEGTEGAEGHAAVEPGDDEYLDDLDGADDEEVAVMAGMATLDETDDGDLVRDDQPPPEVAEAVALVADSRPLLPDAGMWEQRWSDVQAAFVDDPGMSIQNADRLVTEAMEDLAKILLARRDTLQSRWRDPDDPPDTEQLRLTVQGYRALLFGLLST